MSRKISIGLLICILTTILFHVSLSLFIMLMYSILDIGYFVDNGTTSWNIDFYTTQTFLFIGFLPYSFGVLIFTITALYVANMRLFTNCSKWVNYICDFIIPLSLILLMGIFTFIYSLLRLRYPLLCPAFIPPFRLNLYAFFYSNSCACLLYQIIMFWRVRLSK
jgi:hypothetical protein